VSVLAALDCFASPRISAASPMSKAPSYHTADFFDPRRHYDISKFRRAAKANGQALEEAACPSACKG